MSDASTTALVSGLHAGDNPSPGLAVGRCLGEAGHTVVGLCNSGVETGAYHPGTFASVYRMPRVGDAGREYFDRLAYVVAETGASAFLPTLDPEVLFLSRHRDIVAELGLLAPLPDPEAAGRVRKDRLPSLGGCGGFRVPATRPVSSREEAEEAAGELGYPCMIKGAWYEAYAVWSAREVSFRFADLEERWGAPVIVQAMASGTEAVATCLCHPPGVLSRMLSLRKFGVTSQGTTWCGVTFRNETLVDAVEELIAELGWSGPCEVEFLMDERSGTFVLIEVNMRFPSWIYLGAEIGFNLPADQVRLLLGGEPQSPQRHSTGDVLVRMAVDRRVGLDQILALEGEGVLHG